MDASDLCQRLLDHVIKEVPHEREAALGLAALLTFHPNEVRLFVADVMVLLIRNGRSLPEDLVREVDRLLVRVPTVERP